MPKLMKAVAAVTGKSLCFGTGLVVFGFWTLDAFKQNGIGDFITLRTV